MALANLGAAYGTAKAGAGISGMGVSRPDLVMKALIPVVMAGVVGIYGLIIAVIISTKGESHATVAHIHCLCFFRYLYCGVRCQILGALSCVRAGGWGA